MGYDHVILVSTVRLTHEAEDGDTEEHGGWVVCVRCRVVPELVQDEERVDERSEAVNFGDEKRDQKFLVFILGSDDQQGVRDDHDDAVANDADAACVVLELAASQY